MSQLTNSYPFPVLEEDRYDYNEETAYEVSQIEGDRTSQYITYQHHLKGNNLISQLLASGEAKFMTTIVLKSAMYRETLDDVKIIDSTRVTQKIPLRTTFETQSFFSAIVYIGEDKEIKLDALKMGLDNFWDGETIQLLKGSILARDGWRELESTASDLLTVTRDEDLKYGFDVSINSNEGGKFIAKVSTELYDAIRSMPDNNSHRRSIMIHILCVGFMRVHQEYKEDDSILTNFNGIKLELKSKEIKTWEDDDFDANKVACYFLPHKIERLGETNE